MLAADFGFSDAVLAVFVAGLILGWVLLLVLLVLDMLRDPALGGWVKVGWFALMLVFPLIGFFAYLTVRGDDVGRRIGAAQASKVPASDAGPEAR